MNKSMLSRNPRIYMFFYVNKIVQIIDQCSQVINKIFCKQLNKFTTDLSIHAKIFKMYLVSHFYYLNTIAPDLI